MFNSKENILKRNQNESARTVAPMTTRSIKILLLIVIVFWTKPFFGTPTTIQGKAPGYKAELIYLFALDDPFTNHRRLLDSEALGDSGVFTFIFNIDEAQRVFLVVQNAQGELYIKPGENIHLIFPNLPADRPILFDATPVSLVFPDTTEGRLNLSIRAYNAAHARFIDEHFFDFAMNQYSGSAAYKKKIAQEHPEIDLAKMSAADTARVKADPKAFMTALRKWEEEILQKFASYLHDSFFENYVRYSFSELEMLGGMSRKDLYKKYLMSQPVLDRLPPYITLFDAMFGDCIADAPKARESEFIRIINGRQNASALIRTIRGDSILTHDALAEMAALRGLQRVWNDRRFQKNGILFVLNDLKTSFAKPAKWIDNVLESLYTGTSGWSAPNSVLLNEKDEKVEFSSFKGKYVYTIFFANWCSSCLREMQMLEAISAKYKNEVSIVAINMDDDYDQFRKYLSLHKKQDFLFLSGKGDPLLRQKFNLKSIPTCFLFDPEGKLLSDYTKRPSEGIQKEFEKIIARKPDEQRDFNNWKR